VNGSPRLIGNTSSALSTLLDELEKKGFETEQLQIYDEELLPCNACMSCRLRKDGRCINENDRLNEYLEKLYAAEAVILASPVYFGSITSQMKIFLERVGLCSRYGDQRLRRKAGVALVVQGARGGMMAHAELVNFLLDCQMVVCPSSECAVLTAEGPSDLEGDPRNLRIIKDLGREIDWLTGRLR